MGPASENFTKTEVSVRSVGPEIRLPFYLRDRTSRPRRVMSVSCTQAVMPTSARCAV